MDNGANVNIRNSLLLLGEIKKTTTPIKNQKMSFLKDEF